MAGGLAISLAVVVWLRRSSPGARPFAFLMLAAAEWAITRALEAAAEPSWAKVFWAKWEYLGIASVPVLILLFAIEYARVKVHWRRHLMAILWIIPVVTVILAFTNEWHGLIWSSIDTAIGSPAQNLVYTHGGWFWFAAAYSYLTILTGISILAKAIVRRPELYRRQTVPLLIGLGVPVVGNGVYLAGFSPIRGLDLTPFCFTVTGLIYALTIFRLRIFQPVPVARNMVIEAMDDGVIVIDDDGLVLDINPAACRIIGLTGPGVGKHILEVWPDCPEHVTETVREHIAVITVGRDTGDARVLEVRSQPLTKRHGGAFGSLVLIRDVTERKKAEQAIEESERLYRLLADNIRDVVIMADLSMRFLYVSPSMTQLLGYSSSEALNLPPESIFTKTSLEKVSRVLAEELALEQSGSRDSSHSQIIELEWIRKDGSIVPVEAKCGELRDREGRRVGFVCVVRDISERRKAEVELKHLYENEQRSRQQLEIEINRRTEYTRALVHELKTPLTVMVAASELLAEEISQGAIGQLADVLHRGTVELKGRVEELLDLALAERKMLDVRLQPMDIRHLLQDVATAMNPLVLKRAQVLNLDLPPTLPQVDGDQARLRSVVMTLVENASKYTGSGGVIRLSVQAGSDRELVIEVEDNGRGIDPEDLPHIFDPYHRRSRDRERLGGLGIGLPLSKMIVELHGGKIWVNSEPGKGTKVGFSIPVHRG